MYCSGVILIIYTVVKPSLEKAMFYKTLRGLKSPKNIKVGVYPLLYPLT